MGPEGRIIEDDSTEILDTIPQLFRSKDQILYAVQYLQRDHLIDEINTTILSTGKLTIEQLIYLNRLIEQCQHNVAIAALMDTLEGLNNI